MGGVTTESSSGSVFGARLYIGGNHRLLFEWTYGFVGVEAGYVYKNGTQKFFEQEDLIGHSLSVGYEYLSSGGFIFIFTIGQLKAQTDYFGEVTEPTLNLGIGMKFN